MEEECFDGTMAWQLRYASHLGYRSAQEPLFRASVGPLDPLAHIDYAAKLGLAGVQYALARGRPPGEQVAVGAAMAQHCLETGCVIYTGFDNIRRPMWADSGRAARQRLAHELALAFETAHRVGSKHIAVLSGIDPSRDAETQRAAFIENLRWAAERADQAGVVLLLESVDRARLPDMLLHHIAHACDVAAAVDSPAVRLIFDTAHVQTMDGDVVQQLERAWDRVAIVQLADTPGRIEPGCGEIDFAAVLGLLKRRRFRGLVELEFGWSIPGAEAEQTFIERLRRLDAAA
jgi:hydroxypyruvate isomerase